MGSHLPAFGVRHIPLGFGVRHARWEAASPTSGVRHPVRLRCQIPRWEAASPTSGVRHIPLGFRCQTHPVGKPPP
ncbi:MAG: hypothetical protein LBK25_07990 [Treponema sp.]|nr:hypothetical protein [Treponema sp.]